MTKQGKASEVDAWGVFRRLVIVGVGLSGVGAWIISLTTDHLQRCSSVAAPATTTSCAPVSATDVLQVVAGLLIVALAFWDTSEVTLAGILA